LLELRPHLAGAPPPPPAPPLIQACLRPFGNGDCVQHRRSTGRPATESTWGLRWLGKVRWRLCDQRRHDQIACTPESALRTPHTTQCLRQRLLALRLVCERERASLRNGHVDAGPSGSLTDVGPWLKYLEGKANEAAAWQVLSGEPGVFILELVHIA
jgi:hypothetical protein